MWAVSGTGGGDERVGVVKLRFSKAELAAAAAELAAEAAARDSDASDGFGFDSDGGGGEPLLPAPAEDDDDGFDFDVRRADVRRTRSASARAQRRDAHTDAPVTRAARRPLRLTRPRDGAEPSRTTTHRRRLSAFMSLNPLKS
jgi:hypothetical protein